MYKINQNHLSTINPEHNDEYIRSFSQRTGELAGQFLNEFMSGILTLLLVERLPAPGRPPTVRQGTENIGRAPIVAHGPEKLLNGQEVAEYLNISKGKAYRLMSTGQIPCLRYDRTVRVRKQDLENFINNHIVPSS